MGNPLRFQVLAIKDLANNEEKQQVISIVSWRTAYLGTSFFVRVLMLNAVHFLTVTLQRASLREALLAKEALVRPYACVRPRVPLQIKRVIETLPAECAEITLHVTVTLHVAVQEPLKTKVLAAYATCESAGIVFLLSRALSNAAL